MDNLDQKINQNFEMPEFISDEILEAELFNEVEQLNIEEKYFEYCYYIGLDVLARVLSIPPGVIAGITFTQNLFLKLKHYLSPLNFTAQDQIIHDRTGTLLTITSIILLISILVPTIEMIKVLETNDKNIELIYKLRKSAKDIPVPQMPDTSITENPKHFKLIAYIGAKYLRLVDEGKIIRFTTIPHSLME